MVKPYKRLQSPTQSQAQGHIKNGLHIASLMLIACLIAESIERWFHCIYQPTVTLHQCQGHRNEHEHNIWHPYVYCHAKFECNSLNIVRDIASCEVVKFEMHLWPWIKVKVITLAMVISTFTHTASLMGIAWILSKIIKHFLFSWFWSVWPWIKVTVNIIIITHDALPYLRQLPCQVRSMFVLAKRTGRKDLSSRNHRHHSYKKCLTMLSRTQLHHYI